MVFSGEGPKSTDKTARDTEFKSDWGSCERNSGTNRCSITGGVNQEISRNNLKEKKGIEEKEGTLRGISTDSKIPIEH